VKKVVALATIEKGKILLVRKDGFWILPGGKVENNETDIECLFREFKEELPEVKVQEVKFYKEFQGISPIKKELMLLKVYLGKVTGKIFPSAEIDKAVWTKSPLFLNFLYFIIWKFFNRLKLTPHQTLS